MWSYKLRSCGSINASGEIWNWKSGEDGRWVRFQKLSWQAFYCKNDSLTERHNGTMGECQPMRKDIFVLGSQPALRNSSRKRKMTSYWAQFSMNWKGWASWKNHQHWCNGSKWSCNPCKFDFIVLADRTIMIEADPKRE